MRVTLDETVEEASFYLSSVDIRFWLYGYLCCCEHYTPFVLWWLEERKEGGTERGRE